MKTEIVCVVDRSGSMWNVADDAVGSLNEFISAQKTEEGEANLTLVFFNEYPETRYQGDIQNSPVIDSLNPGGSTALLDAVGSSIDILGSRLSSTPESERPDNVIFVILTDGFENASREYNAVRIKSMISHQQDIYNWKFLFLAANQDAFQTGESYGINPAYTSNYANTSVGLRSAYSYINDTVSSLRDSNTSNKS